jgi:cytochrome c-type biogenesis protein CcmF
LKWLTRAFTLLLFGDFALLSYYFLLSDLTVDYVWRYTSLEYPLYYKLGGTLAGQEGTLLFWALLIALGSLWLSESRQRSHKFVGKVQSLVILLGVYFVGLTLLSSPFRSIYEAYPDVPATFVPLNGNGLNPLLLDPWMAAHPFTMFAGYAGTTVPFAAAVVYLYTSLRSDSPSLHKLWTDYVLQSLRLGWLFLTIGIAFGGIWAYKVMGWGGIWAWDPVETASLIPWLVMTASMHLVLEHRRNRRRYSILAPFLVALSFTFVIYATVVTRSGIFESVHAFVAGGAGPYLIVLMALSFLIILALGLVKYLLSDAVEEASLGRDREASSFPSRTNIMYAVALILIILMSIEVFGITYPPIIRQLTGHKFGVGKSFFNLWSYPLFLLLLLLGGVGIHYQPGDKRRRVRVFLLFLGLTLLAAFLKPSDSWNIVDYSAIINPEKPFLYTLVGSISAITILPPTLYFLYAIGNRLKEKLSSLKRPHQKWKEVGIASIHVGILFIALGAVFGNLFVTEITGTLRKGDGQIVQASPAIVHQWAGAWGAHKWGEEDSSPFGIRLVDYREYSDLGGSPVREDGKPPGMSISEVYEHVGGEHAEDEHGFTGTVANRIEREGQTILELTDGTRSLFALGEGLDFPIGTKIVARGVAMQEGTNPSQGSAHPLLLWITGIETYQQVYKTVKEVRVAVYNGGEKIGEATAKDEIYRNGDAKRVGIDRSLLRDVYIIYGGDQGPEIPITVKVIPLINWIWIGVLFFLGGILATFASDIQGARRRR